MWGTEEKKKHQLKDKAGQKYLDAGDTVFDIRGKLDKLENLDTLEKSLKRLEGSVQQTNTVIITALGGIVVATLLLSISDFGIVRSLGNLIRAARCAVDTVFGSFMYVTKSFMHKTMKNMATDVKTQLTTRIDSLEKEVQLLNKTKRINRLEDEVQSLSKLSRETGEQTEEKIQQVCSPLDDIDEVINTQVKGQHQECINIHDRGLFRTWNE